MHHAIKQKRIIDIHSTPATKNLSHTSDYIDRWIAHSKFKCCPKSKSYFESWVDAIDATLFEHDYPSVYTHCFAPSLKTIRATLAPNNQNLRLKGKIIHIN